MSVSRWRAREREQGDPRPTALGCDRRSDRIKAHHEIVLAVLGPDRDATIEEVRENLAEKGLVFGFGTIQRFFARSYSPDFNPVENAFSKLKSLLR